MLKSYSFCTLLMSITSGHCVPAPPLGKGGELQEPEDSAHKKNTCAEKTTVDAVSAPHSTDPSRAVGGTTVVLCDATLMSTQPTRRELNGVSSLASVAASLGQSHVPKPFSENPAQAATSTRSGERDPTTIAVYEGEDDDEECEIARDETDSATIEHRR